MLAFQHSSYLYLLFLLPVFVLLFGAYRHWRTQRLRHMGDRRLVRAQLKGLKQRSATRRFILLALAFTCAVLAAANLRKPGKVVQAQIKGVDVMIALDVSKSMLATDVAPSRLARARQLVTRLLAQMGSNRAGLIVFAGRAYQQVPLTTDFSALRMMLQNAGPQMVPAQGTVISDAIELAQEGFPKNEKKYRTLVVISDGEDHETAAISAAKNAAAAGLVIHTVGVGSPEGATIPDPETRAVKLDEKGAPVISKLNESMLEEIAETGGGTYTLLANPDAAAAKIAAEIGSMEQREMGAMQYTEYTHYFQFFLLPALLCLALATVPGRSMQTPQKPGEKKQSAPVPGKQMTPKKKEVLS